MRNRAGETTRRRLKLESAGLCVKCGRAPASATSTRCIKCAKKHKEAVMAIKTHNVNMGLCKICGKDRDRLEVKVCTKCTAKWAPIRRDALRRIRDNNKTKVIEAYGGRKCACDGCLETNIKFLTIDHINGGGSADREKYGSGGTFYRYLIKNNFPSGFQILCFNCNCGKNANNGVCPHMDDR